MKPDFTIKEAEASVISAFGGQGTHLKKMAALVFLNSRFTEM